MTQSEKLQKVIEKAVENGFDMVMLPHGGAMQLTGSNNFNSTESMIFNHKFAKAFWGEEKVCGDDGKAYEDSHNCKWFNHGCISGWQYHIQQLALTPEDERIDYLYQFIEQK